MMASVERTMTLAENEVPSWRVVQTKRYKERAAQRYLSELGLATYLPLLLQWPRPAVGPEVGPMFPCYLFLFVEARDLCRVGRTAGVRGLVNFGGVPARLDEAAIEVLRAREGLDGIIRANPLPPGAQVMIGDGPFRGLVAVIERRLTARQRVLVLLEILQRQTPVEIPEKWVRQA
jgi:transcription antitermination factor NusG